MKRLCTVIVLMLVLVGVSTVSAIAGVKTITPDQLLPFSPNQKYTQSPDQICGDSTGGSTLYAVVKLPVGQTVKRLVYFHKGTAAGAFTSVALYRSKPNEDIISMAGESSNDYSQDIVTIEDDTINFGKIKSGYKYWVKVYSANDVGYIRGIKIYY